MTLSCRVDNEDSLDYSERAGFLVGKSAALADWTFRKQDRDFKKLCAKLYGRNWARAWRAANPEKARARIASWRAANHLRVNANERARRAKKRAPKFVVCVVCRTKKRVRQLVSRGYAVRFCSKRCGNHYHAAPRARARNRGLRCMTIIPMILDALRAAPGGLDQKAICAASPALKANSVNATLHKLCARGDVLAVGKRGGSGPGRLARRYVLAGAGA